MVVAVGSLVGTTVRDEDSGGLSGPHHEAWFPRVGCSPEHGLHVDNGLGICHIVLFSTHGAFLVHHYQVVSIDDATLQQAVQAAQGKQYGHRISPNPSSTPSPGLGPTAHLRQSGVGRWQRGTGGVVAMLFSAYLSTDPSM